RLVARAAAQQRGVVAARLVDDLADLVERDRPRAAEVVQARGASTQEVLEDAVEVVAVRRRAHLVVVERRRPAVTEARVDPVDGAGVAGGGRPHRARGGEGGGGGVGRQHFPRGPGPRLAVDRDPGGGGGR